MRFVILFILLLALFYVPYAYVSQTAAYRSTYLSLIAKCTSGLLCVLGQNTTATGTLINAPEPTSHVGKTKRPAFQPGKILNAKKGKGSKPRKILPQPEGRAEPPRPASFNIIPGCDGTEGFAMFGAAVLASPFAFRARAVFLVIGMLVLFVVNTIRIATLFILGAYWPDVFNSAHMDLWPGFIIVAVLVCWLSWARWMMRRRSGVP